MKNIKKIIFLVEYPFGLRNYQRFGIDVLEENGFQVEVWDLMALTRPDSQRIKIPDPVAFSGARIFFDHHEALAAISGLDKHCFIVNVVYYAPRACRIYRAISRRKLDYGVLITLSSSPFRGIAKGSKNDLIKYINKIKILVNPHKVLSKIFYKIPYRLLGVQPARFFFAGGETYFLQVEWPSDLNTEILWLHALDYDLYLQAIKHSVDTDEESAVFLDNNLAYHPEFLYLNLSHPATPEKYFPHLCKFFEFLENKYGYKVAVAAHPSSNYDERPDCFGGRPVVRGQTLDLIRKAAVVIVHSSMSINFAVLFKKPMIFVTTDQLQKSMAPQIHYIASLFGKMPINLDHPFEFDREKEFNIDEEAYENFKRAYIKKEGSDNLPFWQIIANRLKHSN